MSFTQEEKNIIQYGASAGKSRTEVMTALGQYRSSLEPEKKDLKGRLSEVGRSTAETIEGSIKGEGEFAGQSPLRRGAQAVAAGATSVPRGALALAPEPVRGAVEAVGEKIAGVAQKGIKQLAGTDLIKGAVGREEIDPVTGASSFVPNDLGTTEDLLGATAAIGEVAGTIAGAGGVAGAVRTGVRTTQAVGTLARKQGQKVSDLMPGYTRSFHNELPDATRTRVVDELSGAFTKSIIADNIPIKKALNKQVAGSRKEGVTAATLVRNLAEEEGFPDINGKKTDFDGSIDRFSTRQDKLVKNIEPLLETVRDTTNLADLKKSALNSIRRQPQFIDSLPLAERQLNKFFESFEAAFKKNEITAKQVNEIRVRMNARSKAFDKGEFVQDTANVIGNTVRTRIDDLVPSKTVTAANAEWGRLAELKLTAEILNNRLIHVNQYAEALGRYGGVLAATGVGGGIVTGSGALVVAGLAAKLGGDKLADMLRKKTFSEKTKNIILQGIRKDEEIVNQLIDEASSGNQAILKQMLLPAKGETSAGPFPIEVGGRGSTRPDPSGSFKPGATQSTNLLEEAKKYKSADEFVKAQGTPVFHGTTKEAASKISKEGFKEGEFASELGKGVYVTSDLTPAKLFGNKGEVIEAYMPNIKTYELPAFTKNKVAESTKIAESIIDLDNLPPTLKGISVDDLAERIRDTWSSENARNWLEKAGYDGITDATSQIKGQTVVFDPKKIQTKSQLEDIWKKANPSDQ